MAILCICAFQTTFLAPVNLDSAHCWHIESVKVVRNIIPLTTSPPLPPPGEAAAFDEEWRREAGRYPPNSRSLDYSRDRRAGGQQLAITAPPTSSPPAGHRHESPRHRQPQTRPRYDWWEVREPWRLSCAWNPKLISGCLGAAVNFGASLEKKSSLVFTFSSKLQLVSMTKKSFLFPTC